MNSTNAICEAARDLWLPFHLFALLAVVFVTIQKIRYYGELVWNLIGAGVALVVLAFRREDVAGVWEGCGSGRRVRV